MLGGGGWPAEVGAWCGDGGGSHGEGAGEVGDGTAELPAEGIGRRSHTVAEFEGGGSSTPPWLPGWSATARRACRWKDGWARRADGEAGPLGFFVARAMRESECNSERTCLPKLLDAPFLDITSEIQIESDFATLLELL